MRSAFHDRRPTVLAGQRAPGRPRRSAGGRSSLARTLVETARWAARWAAGLAALVAATATEASDDLAAVRQELAPMGKLRAGILVGTLGPSTFYTVSDATTEQLRGVTVDLVTSLARELGVPLELVPYPSAEALNLSAGAGAWDVTFMTVDRHREKLVDFGPDYAIFEATYLVPSSSAIGAIADVDRPGIRVSAIRGGGLALRLSQSLRHARLVPAPTLEAAYGMMIGGDVDAIASQRGRLSALAARHPGTRVLDGSFATGKQAIAVPKQRPAALSYVCRFMEGAKASGAVRRALDAAGVKDETVAPPEPCR
jgi:polar amino acid transport system substrate-binding protein